MVLKDILQLGTPWFSQFQNQEKKAIELSSKRKIIKNINVISIINLKKHKHKFGRERQMGFCVLFYE